MGKTNNQKPRSGGKRGGRNSRPKSWEDRESRDMKRDDKRDLKSRSNDPGWYGRDAAILRDAASYPFSYPLGKPIDLVTTEGFHIKWTVPGIMSLRLSPTIGYAKTPASPINVAANAVYSWIRHANSGHSNYDAPDLMLYLIAMANVYSYLNWAQRLYGYAMLYDQKNRYLPTALIESNGVEAASMFNNLASFRYRLNVLINKISAMAVPNTIPYFNRIAFLYQNVYIEGTSIKDQLYQYVPEAFYKFELDDESKGSLTLAYTASGLDQRIGWSEVIELGEELIGAIWTDEDFGIMSGDILKAYGDNIIKLASMPEFYPVVPVYDVTVLHQMKNSIPVAIRTGSNIVTQDNVGNLISEPKRNADVMYNGSAGFGLILTCNDPNPTPEMVMECTRLAPSVHSQTDETIKAGSEIVTAVWATVLNETTEAPDTFRLGEAPMAIDLSDPDPTIGRHPLYRITVLKSFKYAPRFWVVDFVVGSDVEKVGFWIFEVDNYTYLNYYDLEKLHEAAWLNLLNVPSAAKA